MRHRANVSKRLCISVFRKFNLLKKKKKVPIKQNSQNISMDVTSEDAEVLHLMFKHSILADVCLTLGGF